ncbi:UL36 very large tegument protein [Streptomyces sp. CA-132043]|uniref:UL36 very large tegument protein n=1 Tax=Streptomyces sp. CA-132043 TaxID=3240048 RepID=UPI003D8B3AED
MAEARLRDSVDGFAHFLGELVAALDPAEGWYGVFARRDPEGLRACLEGREVPPWDVVESLLHDLSGRLGEQAAAETGARARELHAAAAAAYDTLTGGPGALRGRLDAMLDELRHATGRERELRAALKEADPATDVAALDGELAWIADDVARARARVRELQQRMQGSTEAATAQDAGTPYGPASHAGTSYDSGDEAVAPYGTADQALAPYEFPAEGSEEARPEESRAARRSPGGARFAGLDPSAEGTEGGAPVAPPAPRGARFAGAQEDGGGRKSAKEGKEAAAGSGSGPASSLSGLPPQASQAVTSAVSHLAELRAAGRGGEAHAVLCAAARRPAEELPHIAAELERTGLAADVATLLWEVACLPPEPLAAAAGALAAAGRVQDCVSLLRQGVARPVGEVGDAALALRQAGRTAEARELLAAMVRARTSEEAAGLAAATDAPEVLLPLLLDAADRVSEHRRRDLVHALRTAGVSDRLIGVR